MIFVEVPGESDDDRRVIPRGIPSSVSGTIDDETESRKPQLTKKKRKRFDENKRQNFL